MKLRYQSQCASALVVMLVITTMVSILVAALLMVAREQNNSTARSATWGSEIPMAEAGIEEAMAHLNSGVPTFFTHRWQLSGSNVIKSRYFTNDGGNYASGYFYTAITTSKPPVIVSIGYGRIPRNTN